MKILSWLTISVILHIAFAASFFWVRSNSNSNSSIDYVDLTVTSLSPITNSLSQDLVKKGTPQPKHTNAPIPDSGSINSGPKVENPPSDPNSAPQPSTSDSTEAGLEDTDATAWSEITTLPKIVMEVKAPYPEPAKSSRIEGSVVLDLILNSEGSVHEVILIKGPGYGLDEAAITALKEFKFSPAFKGSQKVAVKLRYIYKFKLGIN